MMKARGEGAQLRPLLGQGILVSVLERKRTNINIYVCVRMYIYTHISLCILYAYYT
jgi:hypothetical protein